MKKAPLIHVTVPGHIHAFVLAAVAAGATCDWCRGPLGEEAQLCDECATLACRSCLPPAPEPAP